MTDKVEIYVRFANDSDLYTKIKINQSKINNVNEIGDEIFCTIDGLRFAIPKEEWNRIKKIN